MAAKNGIERWRGEVSATLAHLAIAVSAIPEQIEAHSERLEAALLKHVAEDRQDFAAINQKHDALAQSHATTRGKLAVMSALVGAAAGVCGQLIAHQILTP